VKLPLRVFFIFFSFLGASTEHSIHYL